MRLPAVWLLPQLLASGGCGQAPSLVVRIPPALWGFLSAGLRSPDKSLAEELKWELRPLE